MKTQDVRDILTVSGILNNYVGDGDEAESIAALIDWADDRVTHVGESGGEIVATVVTHGSGHGGSSGSGGGGNSKSKRGKATESDDSDRVTPDPSSDEPDF